MKSLAQSHLWWLGIDTDIEKVYQICLEFSAVAKAPVSAPLNLGWSHNTPGKEFM